MSNSTKRSVWKRLRKKLRALALRHPYVIGLMTFVGSVLRDSAADYYLPGMWQTLGDFIRWWMG